MSNQPDLSIVILAYKMDGLVKNCLKSIYEHSPDISHEVIVVDNGSNDKCEEIVTSNYPQVKFIQAGGNLGHAKGNNLGIEESIGRHVLVLNPDIVFTDQIFDQVVGFMDGNPDIGMSTVRLRNPDGSIQAGAWRFHSFMTPIYQRIDWIKNSKKGKSGVDWFEMRDWDRKTSRDVDWVQGSFLITRREAIDKIGLFDENLFLYFTDVDWCRRCWEAGYRVHYYSDIGAVHYYHRQSALKKGLKGLTSKVTRIHIKDWIKYLKKYWPNLHLKR